MSDDRLPPSSADLAPKKILYCRVCGRPDDGTTPIWMVAYPQWEHEACIDWTTLEFPYDWKIVQLRAVARALVRAYRTVFTAGRYLVQAQRAWPRNAREHLSTIKQNDTVVHEALRKMREKIDKR